jgi:signal transduction histidine kinase
VLAVGRVQTSVAEVDRFLRSFVATPSSDLEASLLGALDSLREAGDAVASGGYEEEASPLVEAIDSLGASVDEVVELVEGGRLDTATDRVLGLGPRVDGVERRAASVASAVDARAGEDFRRADAISAAGRDAVLLATIVALALAVLMGAWTTRGLARPLERLRAAMVDVAEDGDFVAPHDLPYERRDEIGALSESFRSMTIQLAELDRLKVEFLGVASHELKTPINVIRGYAELIEEELASELTDHQREILQRIAEQTRAMSRMVSRLMDISRLETGTLGMEPEPVLVQDLLLGLERGFEVLAEEKGIELVIVRAADAPEQVEVDVDLVRDEVLGNLVGNALKFTPEGGEVRVEAERGQGGLLVRIADTGPGIPEEHRSHIFERYYRVERTRGLGTGLGLAICRQVAEAHGGWVRLEETGGPGATFVVFLPATA